MLGLIIREPWLGYILSGKKDWELRTTGTKVRGPIALIRAGSGMVFGTATLTDSRQFSREHLARHTRRHRCSRSELQGYNAGKPLYAWKLDNVRRLRRPVSYRHPAGAVIWVRLPDSLLWHAS